MKKITVKIILFSLPMIIFIIITAVFYKNKKSKLKTEFSEYQTLLVGDSQIQRLKGNQISNGAKNIASPGEHYYFTYQKLKRIVKGKNNNIDTIFIGVSIHNFAPVYNRLFNLGFSEGRRSLKRYTYFIENINDFDDISFDVKMLKSLIIGVYSQPNWGGEASSTNSMPNDTLIEETFNMHYAINKNEKEFCYAQRNYLYKIDSLCLDENIELILVSTPYHSLYKEKIEEKYSAFFVESLMPLKHRAHLNYLNDKIHPSLMSDANHLNLHGAKIYSALIKSSL